jgi:hypothetical protein
MPIVKTQRRRTVTPHAMVRYCDKLHRVKSKISRVAGDYKVSQEHSTCDTGHTSKALCPLSYPLSYTEHNYLYRSIFTPPDSPILTADIGYAKQLETETNYNKLGLRIGDEITKIHLHA